MDTVVLTTLLFNTAGIVVTGLVMALACFPPSRRRPRNWVREADADATGNVQPQAHATELPHAA